LASYIEAVDITYTLAENDSILRRFNPIDASYFKEHAEPDGYPLHVSQHKTVYKVYRRHYALQEEQAASDRVIKSTHRKDVSSHYGLNGKVEIDVSSDIAHASLSIFRTGLGWTEIAYTNKQRDKILFSGLGRDVMYLITRYDSLGLKHVGDPFYLSTDTNTVHFGADGRKETVTLYRKYPLFGNWVAQWQRMLGGTYLLVWLFLTGVGGGAELPEGYVRYPA